MLTDDFGRTIDYVRISVTDRCDLRCSYCIPKGYTQFTATQHWLTFDEIERVVAAFARLGTQHFRLTGGEPLLRKNLPELVGRLSRVSGVTDLSITTNGTQLVHQAEALFNAGVRRLNVSLDSLRQACVRQISGKDSLNRVLQGLTFAKQIGFHKIKINMVLLDQQNVEDVEHMVNFCIENEFILCLIEVMPMGSTGQRAAGVNLHDVVANLQTKYRLLPSTKVIGNGPARYWQTSTGDFILGLITPLSQHFCATCNRVRLAVDGTLYMCLGQDHRYALRPLLRANCSDAELSEAIVSAIRLKPQAHTFVEDPTKIIRFMSMTGG